MVRKQNTKGAFGDIEQANSVGGVSLDDFPGPSSLHFFCVVQYASPSWCCGDSSE